MKYRMLRQTFLIVFFVILVICSKKDTIASTLSPDPTFGVNGKVISTFNNSSNANSAKVSPLGKIIVVGTIEQNQTNKNWLFSKYNLNGSIDNTFGINGSIIKDFGPDAYGHGDFLRDLLIQPDGKIVVAGSSSENTSKSRWTLARYDSNGNLDTPFGNSGIVITNLIPGSIIDYINKLILQPDNKIIAIGITHASQTDIAVTRNNIDGSPDINFGNNGTVILPIGNSNDRSTGGVIQPDGKIVVVGEFDAGGHDEIFVARFNSDGSLNSSFGNNGITKQRIGTSGSDQSTEAVLQSDGKIVIAGGTNWNYNVPSSDTFVARFNSDGSLDSSFGSGGKFIQSFSGLDVASSLFIQPDGKIVIGGYEMSPTLYFAIRRFNSNGTLDSSFATNGSFTEPTGFSTGVISTILRQNDGKILLAGYGANGGNNNWLLARFTTSEPSPDINLNVPLLKQTSNPWKKQVYDSAKLWNPIDPSINSWGCALTSAAMVFKYHGINKLPNNKPLDPGTLNTWLRSQKDGYIGNGFINWLALSRLSKLAKNINGLSFDALEYSRNNGNSPEILLDNLENNLPGILSVPGHFVVAKGIEDNIFTINDPYYPRTSLSDYGNTFQNLGTYTPSNTDLSYIMITTNPNTQIELQDSDGDLVGETTIEDPIVNPEDPEQKNESLKILYLPKPSDTSYNLVITSSGNYEVKIYLYDKNGEVFTSTETGTLPPEQTKIIPINFNGQENLYEKRTTYILTTLEIEKLFLKKQITSRKVKKELEEVLARAAIQKVLKNDEKQLGFLREFEDILNENKGTNILPHAYETLLYNVNYLSSNL